MNPQELVDLRRKQAARAFKDKHAKFACAYEHLQAKLKARGDGEVAMTQHYAGAFWWYRRYTHRENRNDPWPIGRYSCITVSYSDHADLVIRLYANVK